MGMQSPYYNMVIPMKKTFIFILIVSILFAIPAKAREEEYISVSDGALVISEEVERYIYTQNKELEEKTGARIIFATISDSGENSVTDYADLLYKELGIGSIGRRNSVFVLLCMEENEYCIKLSDGISAALTESQAQKMLVKYMEKDFAKSDYDDAVLKTYNHLASWYEEEYDINLSLTEDLSDYKSMVKTEKERKLLKNIIITSLAVIAAGGALYALVRYRRKKRMQNLLKKRQERRRRYAQSLRGK